MIQHVEGITKWSRLFVFALLCSCTSQVRKENIILIVADDLGWRDVQFNNNDYFVTPALNRLAAEGMVFTNAYSNAPNCAPSRAAMLTGLYGPRTGIYTVETAARGKSVNRKIIPVENIRVLDTSFVIIPEILKKYGYATAHFGKWHLGEGEFTGPVGQGFDQNTGGGQAGFPKSYFSPYENEFLPDGPKGENLTDRLSFEAAKFVEKNSDNPFFLYLPYYAVHTPLQGKKDLVEEYVGKESPLSQSDPTYGAMVQTMDAGIDSVLSMVRRLGIEEHTTVIFISDNGPYFPASSAEPLRGSKGMLYEGGIRVPLLIKSRNYRGKTDTPVIGLDLYTTIMDIADIPSEAYPKTDGASLLPVLEGKSIPQRPLFWHFPAYLGPYRGMESNWRTTPVSVVRFGDWKLLQYFEDSTLELYHLKNDISESENLVSSEPAKRDELLKLLQDWQRETNAFIPVKLNPEFEK